MAAETRSAFPVRFRDPRTRSLLKLVAEQLGMSMNEVAEQAIRHELVLLGADLERKLADIVLALRHYEGDDLEAHVVSFAEGEASGLDPFQARQSPDAAAATFAGRTRARDPLGVLAAFGRE